MLIYKEKIHNQRNRPLLKVSFWVFLMAFLTPLVFAQTQAPTLTITEVMYNPAGEDMIMVAGRWRSRQWLELYNPTASPVEIISGIGEEVWTFIDSTGTHFFAKTPAQGDLIIAPGEYIVLAGDAYVFLQEYPWYTGTVIDLRMELQHQYDFIQIKGPKGEVISQTIWSYNIGGNGNGKTLEFYGRDNVKESLFVGGTPGKANISPYPLISPNPASPEPSPVIPKETITTKPYPQALSLGKVLINELFPGTPTQAGWVELRSLEPYPIDINGWKIKNLKQSFVIPTSTIISAYGFLVIEQIDPSQSGDVIDLYNHQGTLLFEVEYETPISPFLSVARFPAGWAITSTPTKTHDNIFTVPPTPLNSPIIIEANLLSSPTSTILSQVFDGKLPLLPALMTAIIGTLVFIAIKRRFTW
jgi:hypothetical protein